MEITLTAAALNQLKSMTFKEEQFPRIDADIAGGCGISMKFAFVFDEPRRNDLVIEYDGILIRIDRFTKRYLDIETKIDYIDGLGFLVGENFVSSDCAVEIEL
ncbi:iron-sulfur cluster biosynthesis family protein [Bacillus sp. B190/17]|uniref:Iron-sulfur cluster biosynthesis family protein n=1 Tax=Bacillus lumedeiriae TaxID=3058829 RepID=A0ABW8IB04_9BACI